MTVIQPNSVAGINSITVQSGNSLAVHKANGELIRTITSNSGVSTFSSISVGTAATTNSAGKSINIGLGASISQHDANTLSFGTNGDERLKIESNGDVTLTNTSSNPQLAIISAANGIGEIQFGDTADSVRGNILYRSGSAGDALCFNGYNNTERLRIGSDGKVGVNTTAGAARLTVDAASGYSIIANGNSNAIALGSNGIILFGNKNAQAYGSGGYDATEHIFKASGSEKVRIDSSGRLIIGTNTSRSVGDVTAQIQLEGNGFAASSLSLISNAGASAGNTPHLTLGKSRGSSDGSNTIVVSGDALGQIQFSGADGTDCNTVASSIIGRVDGTPGSNDMPGNLTFNTTADGAASPTERMRLTSAGDLLLHTTGLNNSAVAGQALQISGTTRPTLILRGNGSGSNVGEIQFADNSGSDDDNTGIRAGLIQYDHSNNNMNFRVAGTYTGLKISGTNGRLERNFTGGSSIDDDGMWFNNGGTTSGTFIRFWQTTSGANQIGSISHNATNTAYNTSSDYRLKENAVSISDGITRLKTLKPYRFNFKTEPSKTVDGFFAHEAATVVPEAVTGTKDEVSTIADTSIGVAVGDPVHQGMDYGKITPLLTAALQEAITKIETLETKVAALEGG